MMESVPSVLDLPGQRPVRLVEKARANFNNLFSEYLS